MTVFVESICPTVSIHRSMGRARRVGAISCEVGGFHQQVVRGHLNLTGGATSNVDVEMQHQRLDFHALPTYHPRP